MKVLLFVLTLVSPVAAAQQVHKCLSGNIASVISPLLVPVRRPRHGRLLR